jgi:hypothetical protein
MNSNEQTIQKNIDYEEQHKRDDNTQFRHIYVSPMAKSILPEETKIKTRIITLPNKPIGRDYQTITKPVAIIKPRTRDTMQENQNTSVSNSTPNNELYVTNALTSNNTQTTEEHVGNSNNPNLTSQNETRRRPVRVLRKFAQNAVLCVFSLFCL